MNDNFPTPDLWAMSIASMPKPGTSEYARLRANLESTLREPKGTMVGNLHDHTREAIGFSHRGKTVWVEPSESREDALIEAHRLARDVSGFRTAFIWACSGRWYAHIQRPAVPEMGSFSGVSEITAVEIGRDGEVRVSVVVE